MTSLRPYADRMPRARESAQRRIERAIEDAVSALIAVESTQSSHMARAVLADQLATAATRLSRAEVMAARDVDGATWDDVANAFGVTRQAAHERFRTGPDGLHSRYFKRQAR